MAPMNPEDARMLGELQARVRGLEGWLESIADDVKAIKVSVDSAAGGWKLVAGLGLPAAVGGALVALLGWMAKH